ncbi:type II toxin-antitoxin system VapC family toxin [Falsiroseomonas sp. E2-1-a20]|uniref:type II toxin-antitoxin system VapC family toxin n=1 Tax=Falsiroseomonas sp. E2-1-a20 TaxID=3239300 RepID=UPI003F315328
MIVLDTNVLSELLRPAPQAAVLAWAQGVPRASVTTTAVTEAEIRFGLALLPAGGRRDILASAIDALFADRLADRVLAFDRAAAPHYAQFAAFRRAAGRPVATADAMIAAIACARGAAAIATRNTADFEGCGLPLIDPWQTG